MAGAPRPAGRGVGPGRGLWPAGRGKSGGAPGLSGRMVRCEQALRVLQHLPEGYTRREQAIALRLDLRHALA